MMHVTGNRRIAVECTKIKTGPFGAGNTARALTQTDATGGLPSMLEHPPPIFDFPDWDRSEPIDIYKLRRSTAVKLYQARQNSMLYKTGPSGPLYRLSAGGNLARTKPLSASRRNRVKDRDGHACIWCGSREDLEVDHIRRYADGGSNDMDNLRTLCRRCHRSRGDA